MNNDALEQKLVALIPAMQGYAGALTRNAADADDLVQETVARAITRLHQFQPGTNFRSWVLRIERNLWFNEFRRRRREGPAAEADVHPGSCAPDQEWHLVVRDMEGALDRLKPEHRDVLMAVGADGATYEETARRQGCEIGTVKSRLFRAREALAAELGIHSTDDAVGRTPGPHAWNGWQVTVLQ